MKRPVTWILIADGGRAKIFKAASKGRIEEKEEMATALPPTRDLVSDRPGRTFDSMGQGRHAKEPPTDAHEKAESDFLRSVCKKLDAACQNKEFDRLIVVAAPRALGTLRQMFPGQLADMVTKEISHDLTGFTRPALETYLREREII
jgi:protein required for attachment to host cells